MKIIKKTVQRLKKEIEERREVNKCQDMPLYPELLL
jgi:hypothetical protein